MTCKHAESGCNSPEGECMGICFQLDEQDPRIAGYFQVEYHGGQPLYQQVGRQHKDEDGVFPLFFSPE